MKKEADLYDVLPDGAVRCRLCNHYCRIADGHRGVCGVREAQDGRLYTLVYDRVVAIHADPIEKKPLFHFLPGSRSLSVATVGCNFRCDFCQNYSISMYPREHSDVPGDRVSPAELVQVALDRKCRSISYTYTEPTIFFELARDTGILARQSGLRNVFVSNGYMSREALDKLPDFLDAANIDLKSFSDEFYRSYCGARLDPVLESIRALHAAGIWIEITTLVIPGLNSSPDELARIAGFIASVDARIPWHVSAFHPDYHRLSTPPTSVRHLEAALAAGEAAGLKHVYGGNVPGHPSENTHCPECGTLLIERRGFTIRRNLLTRPVCPTCGHDVAVILE